MEQVDQKGNVLIRFNPPIVLIPNDWEKLWNLEEREKMSIEDQASFDKELLKIMHVQFEKNSDELEQKFFISNLTRFEPDGISVNLNFSDPILIS